MELKIHQKTEDELYNKTEAIVEVTKDDKSVGIKMFDIMKQANGVGLAASQVGYGRNIIVVSYGPDNYIMYNPEIIKTSDSMDIHEEACLSFPGEKFKVRRHQSVTVRWLTGKNEVKTKRFTGFIATIMQHEIDHNNGITMEMKYNEQNSKQAEAISE